ncbi:hypothetical protein ACJX0J_019064 [Zea mays]
MPGPEYEQKKDTVAKENIRGLKRSFFMVFKIQRVTFLFQCYSIDTCSTIVIKFHLKADYNYFCTSDGLAQLYVGLCAFGLSLCDLVFFLCCNNNAVQALYIGALYRTFIAVAVKTKHSNFLILHMEFFRIVE